MFEPDFYTVEEAARVLRLGRTTAYRLVKLFVATGGDEGIHAVVVGGQYRVPRTALEALAGGPVRPPSGHAEVDAPTEPRPRHGHAGGGALRSRKRR